MVVIYAVFPNILTYSSFFPVILQALRQTPFIGPILSLPYIRGVSVSETRLSAMPVVAYDVFL